MREAPLGTPTAQAPEPPPPASLAPFAVDERSRGRRRHPEAPPAWRTQFQRDRDRIIHCSAFRRLDYKTQVFINREWDMFRSRLTHTLEVSQVARTVARALCVNEDLTEAITLAHDLGHTPFGHAGQHALNACMKDHGGFEHNRHSLRVVDRLEHRYPDFPGLNLLFDTREGILKHCSREWARKLGPVAARFIAGGSPSIEAQIANLADEVAYNHHDIDDGLRAGLLDIEQLEELDLFATTLRSCRRSYPGCDTTTLRYTVLRRMLNHFVVALIEHSRCRIARLGFASVAEVRGHPENAIGFPPDVLEDHLALKRILRRRLYEHESVRNRADRAAQVLTGLFHAYSDDPERIPDDYRGDVSALDARARAQLVTDYLAGMTDRFAMSAHETLTGRRKTSG